MNPPKKRVSNCSVFVFFLLSTNTIYKVLWIALWTLISTNNFAKRYRNISKEKFLYLPPHPRPTTPPRPATLKQSTKLDLNSMNHCT